MSSIPTPLYAAAGRPTLSLQLQYPMSMSISFDTCINRNMNGSEQRWKRRAPLFSFEIPLQCLLRADTYAWSNPNIYTPGAFDSAFGAYSSNVSLTVCGTTYNNLAFDADEIAFTLNRPLEYTGTIKLYQTQNRGFPSPGPLDHFPTLTDGFGAQLPVSIKRRYFTSQVRQPSGPTYSWKWYGTTSPRLVNFPVGALFAADLEYNTLSNAALTTLMNAVVGWDGELAEFDYVDPTNTDLTYPCRLVLPNGMFAVQMKAYNVNSAKLGVIQTN